MTGAVTLLTTSFAVCFPRLSVIVSLKTTESPLIFSTKPLNTGSFSFKLYCFFAAFSTIAIIPDVVFTTPFSTTWSMIRQRAPVVHTEVDFILSSCNRIGLMKGSRRPAVFTTVAVSCFFATGFGALALASALPSAFAWAFFAVGVSTGAFGFAARATIAFLGTDVVGFTVCDAGLLAACAGLVATVVGFAAAGFAAAGFAGAVAGLVAVAGA